MRTALALLLLLPTVTADARRSARPRPAAVRQPRHLSIRSLGRRAPLPRHTSPLDRMKASLTRNLAQPDRVTSERGLSLVAKGRRARMPRRNHGKDGASSLVRAAMVSAYGPMGDLLYGASAKQLVKRHGSIKRYAKNVHSFHEELARQDTLADLEGLRARWNRKRLPPFARNALLKAYMNRASAGDKRAWQAAARYWEQAVKVDPTYRNDEIGREFYIVALNKSGRIADSITESRRYISELSGGPAGKRGAARNRRLNGEVLAGVGKAFKLIHERAAKGEKVSSKLRRLVGQESGGGRLLNKGLARAALDISTRYYEKGFLTDFEYYPGIVSVYNNYERGDVKRAERLAPLVWAATQRAGGMEAKDYWCLATQVELSLIMRKDRAFARLFPRMLERANVSWELSSTVDKMKTLAALRDKKGENTATMRFAIRTLQDRIAALDRAAQRIEQASQRGQGDVTSLRTADGAATRRWLAATRQEIDGRFGREQPANRTEAHRRRVTQALLSASGDFRAMTTSHAIGGNVQYGGQIPDTTLTRGSVRVVRQLLRSWGLDRVTSFSTWNRRVNARLNTVFELGKRGSPRRPLEDLHSPEHDRLDRYDRQRFALSATKDSGDSRTDLLAIMALGVGDCRPTAFAKQLLFDVWRRDNVNRLMRQAYEATMSGDVKTRDQLLGKIDRMERKQLRVVTMELRAPVQMRRMYEWITDDRGRPKADPVGRFNPVENHTFNILVEFDKQGLVKPRLRTADAFYRKLYPLGQARLRASDILSGQGFKMGFMGIRDSAGRHIAYRMKPTRYSGELFKPFEVGSSDFRYCGQTVAPAVLGTIIDARSRNHRLATDIANIKIPE